MTIATLTEQVQKRQSYLCIGLDTDTEKLPPHLKGKKDAVVLFNKAIIDATKDYCVSYKINTAFYESQGIKGWQAMEETLHHIPATHFTIADAKRGDIGNTSAHYAKTFFETLPFDAVTVNPYMGEDSVRPFLEYEDKVTILLGLTSNKGAQDFEMLSVQDHFPKKNPSSEPAQDSTCCLYEMVLQKATMWGTVNNLMFVVGATQTEQLSKIRSLVPNHFLLVPGVGAQGGSLQDVSQYGMNKDCGLLVNVSRAIIYAGDKEDFAKQAAGAAKAYQADMQGLLSPTGWEW